MAGMDKTIDSVKGRGKMLIKKPWRAHDLGAGIKDGATDLGMLFTPDIPIPKEEPIIAMPTQSTSLLEAKRRRATKSSSGRNSTILTEGLGG